MFKIIAHMEHILVTLTLYIVVIVLRTHKLGIKIDYALMIILLKIWTLRKEHTIFRLERKNFYFMWYQWNWHQELFLLNILKQHSVMVVKGFVRLPRRPVSQCPLNINTIWTIPMFLVPTVSQLFNLFRICFQRSHTRLWLLSK